ncbi:MAG: hypothetical protein IPF81_12070 [Bacteroidetes bacterium]|nr:hypothetical protein [Bacteroidota bacterium]
MNFYQKQALKLSLATCTVFSTTMYGQSLPDEMHLSPDGRMLLTGDRLNTGLFEQSTMRNIYLDFSQSNYWTQLTQNYQSKIDLPATMTVDGIVYDSVGVRFKGQTSYSGVQNSQKEILQHYHGFIHPESGYNGIQYSQSE